MTADIDISFEIHAFYPDPLLVGRAELRAEGGALQAEMDADVRKQLFELLWEKRAICKASAVFSEEQLAKMDQEAVRFRARNEPKFSKNASYWDHLERWAHVRKPQVRDYVSIAKGCPNLPFTRAVGEFLIRLRNAIQEWPTECGIEGPELASMNYSHYPVGGGFMIEHRDSPEEGTVVILNMSKRGKDFQQGGLFLRTEEGELIDVEEHLEAGDILLARPDLRHGVAAIDPKKAWEEQWTTGRRMLFAPMPIANDYVLVP